ncbi:MAG: hypothetical protein KJ709_04555 [Nanoarchaeota archaeon]|nr:hypothetical protein [Nanoarchaeota archaeon]
MKARKGIYAIPKEKFVNIYNSLVRTPNRHYELYHIPDTRFEFPDHADFAYIGLAEVVMKPAEGIFFQFRLGTALGETSFFIPQKELTKHKSGVEENDIVALLPKTEYEGFDLGYESVMLTEDELVRFYTGTDCPEWDFIIKLMFSRQRKG